MQVDGRPNVRTCIEAVQQGQVVKGQHAWPGLRFDLLRAFDRLSWFLPAGFYYKRFHKPRWVWPLFERSVRHVAGLGRIDVHAPAASAAAVEHLQTEVCVIGAGPAGLAAAGAAAEAGRDVVLLERQLRCGGHLLYEGRGEAPSPPGRVRVLLETTAFGLYEGNLVAAFQRDRLLKIRARQIIVCTGGRQRPFLFPNNDLPGIFLGRGVLRLARLYGIRAGRRAVIATDNDEGHHLAKELAALGIEVLAIVERRPTASPPAHRFPVLPGHGIVRARGNTHLRAVHVAPLTASGDLEKIGRKIACDLLCLVSRLVPANELLHQGGMRFDYQGGRWLPSRSISGLLAAGAAAGTFELEAQIREGRLRGQEAVATLRRSEGTRDEGQGTGQEAAAILPSPLVPGPSPLPSAKAFVCLCEDVTAKDLTQAVAEGFDHIETLKRYSTVGMGPCQGKVCGATATEVCAQLTARDITAVGTTTSRPPVVPVELALLAAERQHQPIRRTPMYHWHQAAGASWLDAGLWKRPESYGDPATEVRVVRTTVGLIDVSTLGKIEVLGPDAAELLERVYINGWTDLAVGRTRYGVMCTEEGIVFDDGVGARLESEHFYLTATTGNAEAVFQWLELWRATWRLNAVVLNQTSAFAAMNLAGPRAREVLGRLTPLDLTPAAFPYLAARSADVAGVPCRLLRVGFVGELGYEIHCASALGWHLWEALIQAGAEFGLKPFGVEAQRILRLEKGHLIVGQDTDALSDPFGAGMERLVRFRKPMFVGREALQRYKALSLRSRLVGFHLSDNAEHGRNHDWARRLEGCQVVDHGRPVGRVTSARYSPTLEHLLGLAWVPTAMDSFVIRCDGADLAAKVVPVPFYDPEGKRLKT
jgi:sarcosine oxidase subunit alpha